MSDFEGFIPLARTRAQLFLDAATIRFIPSLLIRRFGFDGSAVASDLGLECFTGRFFGMTEEARELTASFARVTAPFAYRK